MENQKTILTIGYSNVDFNVFLEKAKKANITAIADVRSTPYSKYTPQFNREAVKESLKEHDIAYVYVGNMIGGWPKSDEYYTDGIADYTKMVNDKTFNDGLERIIKGSEKYNIALACSEQNPFTCHRFLLVSRELLRRGYDVRHVMKDGSIKSHHEVEQDMIESLTRKEKKFVEQSDDKLDAAYWCENRRHGHKEKK